MEEEIKKPSLFLHLTEVFRAFFEIISGFFFLFKIKTTAVKNGKVILVLPGLLSSDFTTSILRKYLTKLGFQVYGWGLGRNLGRLKYLQPLAQRIEELSKQHDKKIILVGWSMGGIFARELAKMKPEYVEKVLTMGSPFANVYAPNHARWVFDLLNNASDLKKETVDQLGVPPALPTIALYSKQDGIVPWKVCMDYPETAQHRNIEIKSSHFGMGANAEVLKTVGEVL